MVVLGEVGVVSAPKDYSASNKPAWLLSAIIKSNSARDGVGTGMKPSKPLTSVIVTTDGYRPEIQLESTPGGWRVLTHDLGGLSGMRWTLAIDDGDAEPLSEPFVHREDVPLGARIPWSLSARKAGGLFQQIDVPRDRDLQLSDAVTATGCSTSTNGFILLMCLVILRRRRLRREQRTATGTF